MPNYQNQISFQDPYAADEYDLQRRQAYADALAKQSMTPLGGTEMAGPIAIRRSPLEGMAKLMQGYSAGQSTQDVMRRRQELAKQMQVDRTNSLNAALQQMQGRPAQIQDTSQEGTGSMDMSGVQGPANIPGIAPNPQGAYMALAQSNDPSLRQVGTAGMISRMMPKPMAIGKTLVDANNPSNVLAVDQTWQAEEAAKRQDRMTELKMRLEDQRLSRQERADLQRELAAQSNALRRDLASERQAGANKPPPGYMWGPPDAQGQPTMRPVSGGPADTKIQGQFNQDTAALQSTTSDLDRLASEANALKNHPGLSKSTGVMSVVPGVGGLASIPGSDAANFKARLDTLKSQVAFGVLQNMRNNSKTGGALGQVSDREEKMLAENLASLDRAQSATEFKSALGRIIDYTNGAKDRMRAAYNMKHPDQNQNAQPSSNVDELLKKYQ